MKFSNIIWAIGVVFAFITLCSIFGCNTQIEMQACGQMCSKTGVKALRWNSHCECFPPPSLVEHPDMGHGKD